MLAQPYVILVVAFLLSIMTYYFVENQVRFRKSKTIPIILLAVIFLIGITAFLICKNASYFEENYIQQIIPQILSQYQRDMQPSENDFYYKNGRKLPNSSKNRNRLAPTVDKLKISGKKQTDDERYNETVLQKKIDNTSKYYKASLMQYRRLHHFEVANEGRQNQLFLIGDSHGRYIIHRLMELFRQSKRRNRLDSFPTIVTMLKDKSTFKTCDDFYKPIMELIEQHRPQRVFFVYKWLLYWQVEDGFHPHAKVNWSRNQKNFQANIENFSQSIKYIKSLGIDVWVSAINPQGPPFNPDYMTDGDGIINRNIKPVRLSEFRKQNYAYIKRFETKMKQVGAGLIDFSGHQCWEDICEMLSPSGYSIYFDNSHQTKVYSRFWASTVDFLTQF